MELDSDAHAAIALGRDLQLVIDQGTSPTGRPEWKIHALSGSGSVLDVLARSKEVPTDATITAARQAALYLFPDHVDLDAAGRQRKAEAQPKTMAEAMEKIRPLTEIPMSELVAQDLRPRPHRWERRRDTQAGVFICKHCEKPRGDSIHDGLVEVQAGSSR